MQNTCQGFPKTLLHPAVSLLPRAKNLPTSKVSRLQSVALLWNRNRHRKSFPFEALKEELELVIKLVTKMAEEQLNTSDARLVSNPDGLIQCNKQRMPPDEFDVQTPEVNIPAGLGPYFYELPRELRDEIFSDLHVSDHLGLMRTSKAMKQEGETWFTKKGIYRINLGRFMETNCQKPSPEILATIQNVDISINYSTRQTLTLNVEAEFKFLELFASPTRPRNTCTVIFEYNTVAGYVAIGYEILVRVKRLEGFKKVVFRTGIDWAECWAGHTAILFPSNEAHDPSVPDHLEHKGFKWVQEFLEPSFGKADLKSDEHGWTMVFYPPKAQEAGLTGDNGGNSSGQA